MKTSWLVSCREWRRCCPAGRQTDRPPLWDEGSPSPSASQRGRILPLLWAVISSVLIDEQRRAIRLKQQSIPVTDQVSAIKLEEQHGQIALKVGDTQCILSLSWAVWNGGLWLLKLFARSINNSCLDWKWVWVNGLFTLCAVWLTDFSLRCQTHFCVSVKHVCANALLCCPVCAVVIPCLDRLANLQCFDLVWHVEIGQVGKRPFFFLFHLYWDNPHIPP